ncbi:pantoate-beta-alanine ligase [Botrytis cinerea]
MMPSPMRQSMLPLLSSTTKVYGAPRAFSTTSALLRRVANPTIPGTSIKIFRDVPALRQWRRKQLIDHRMVGLVPTMGALHEGHLSLIRLAAAENSNVVLSEDMGKGLQDVEGTRYGTSRQWDMGKIAAVFAPTTETMYPSGPPSQEVAAKGSFITITPVGELLEGASRPTFFRGVATVCMKLFNIVMPDSVYFGQKDVQQTVVIKKMVKDFCFDTKVIIGETQREHDGLALSSRNVYLGTRRRNVATALSNMLKVAEQGYNLGRRSRDELLGPALELSKIVIDGTASIEARRTTDPETMEEIQEVDETKGAILSGAIKMLPVEAPQVGEDLGLSDGPQSG